MLGRGLLATAPAQIEILAPPSQELDLMKYPDVLAYLQQHPVDVVIHAAARVGGIQANIEDPAGFLYENSIVNLNVIHAAAEVGISRLINLGSSCMYPRDHTNPLREEYLLAAPLEPTNEGYALAKLIGAKLCEYYNRQRGTHYKTFIPSNLYGRFDHFDPRRSHLVPAVLLKLHQAKLSDAPEVVLWGDGSARREFLFADDLCRFIWDSLDRLAALPTYLNLGYGTDFSVLDYYQRGKKVVGYRGDFVFDLTKPVGMNRKLLDSSKATALGWRPLTDLETGMTQAYNYYLSTQSESCS